MANKNEAKITFNADVAGFNKAISNANSTMTELRAEMKLNETQMKATGVSVEGLEKKHGLLESQLKTAESKTEALANKLEVATRTFGENSNEASKLRTQLLNAQTAEEKLRHEVSEAAKALDDHKAASEVTRTATEKLTDTIDKQQNELDKLKSEYTDVVLQQGKSSAEAKDLAKQIDDLSGELNENKNKLDDAEEAADDFDNTLEKTGDTSEKLTEKLDKVAVGAAALGAAFIAAGKEAIDAFNEVDEGADNVIKATGATGESAEALEEAYKHVASSIVGDFGDIGSTLGEVNTRFGFTGTEAEKATEQFLKFAEVTGMDGVSAVQAVSRAIESAGLKSSDYGNILDALTTAGQATGISVDALATALTDNGAVMREMGYDTQTTIAMLAQFEKAGVDSNTVVRGMRTAMATWAKDGKDAKTEFSKLVEGIKNGSVDAGAAYEAFGSKAGAELVDAIKSGRFEYEDMVAVIEGSKGSLDNTFDGTIDGGYELELAMQNAKMALAEAGEEVGTALTPALQTFSTNVLPIATKGISAMVDGISAAVGWMKEHKGIVIAVASVMGVLATAITAYNVVQGIKNAMDALNVTTVWGLVAAHIAQAAAAMAAIAPYVLIVAAIAAVIAIIVVCVKHWDEIVAAVSNCWKKVKETLGQWGSWINDNVIKPVVEFFKGLWDGIVNIFKSVINWVKDNWKAIVGFIINPFAGVFIYLYENFEGFRNFVNDIIQKIVGFFKGLWKSVVEIWDKICNAIKIAFQLIGSIINAAFQIITLPFRFIWENCKEYVFAAWEWIKDVISTAINAVKNVINTVMTAIKSVFTTVWGAIKSTVSTVWDAIKSKITTVVNAIKTKISAIWNSIKTATSTAFNAVKNVVTNVWNSIKNAITTVVNAIKTKVTSVWNSVKTATTTAFNAVKTNVSSIWNGVKSTIANVVNGVKNTVSNVWTSIKTKTSNVFNSLKTTVSNIFTKIKTAITKPINSAKDAVGKVVDKIKGIFNKMKLKFPDIKMPHFKITPKGWKVKDLLEGSVPKLGIEFYAKGGILTKPTIFGFNGNRAMLGGEAGAEAILPIEKLPELLAPLLDRQARAADLSPLVEVIADLASRPLAMNIDGKRFAYATAGATDSVGGIRDSFAGRGLALD